MVQDLEKNFEKNVNKARDGQNESVIKKQVFKAESLWKGYAEKSFEVDPNYKTWGYVRGICVYLGFEAMCMFIGGYFGYNAQEQATKFQDIMKSAQDNSEDAILKGQLAEFLKNIEPVVAQAACVAVFYVFLNFFIFKCAKRVLKHHGKVLTGRMNYYSLLAIFMPFYFVYQSIGLPFGYGLLAFSSWGMKKVASQELTKVISQPV